MPKQLVKLFKLSLTDNSTWRQGSVAKWPLASWPQTTPHPESPLKHHYRQHSKSRAYIIGMWECLVFGRVLWVPNAKHFRDPVRHIFHTISSNSSNNTERVWHIQHDSQRKSVGLRKPMISYQQSPAVALQPYWSQGLRSLTLQPYWSPRLCNLTGAPGLN
jgi:hypothetical protein